MKIPTWYTRDGRFTHLGGLLTLILGLAFAFLSVAYMPLVWLRYAGLVIGLTIAVVAGYEGKAHGLGLPPPFTNDPLGWRKAKESYKVETQDKQEDTDKQ